MQGDGIWVPEKVPSTLEHEEVVLQLRPEHDKLMSRSCTFLQGTSLLHNRLIATFVLEVPLILLKITLLISTCDGCTKNQDKF